MKLNQELLEMQDPVILSKNREISRLKKTITAFKKYDEERKKFIQKLQFELEDVSYDYLQLKHKIPKDALEVGDMFKQKINDLKGSVKGQNKKIESLNKIINLMKDPDALTRAEEILKNYTVIELKEANQKLEKQVADLRKTNSELIYKIVKLQKQNNNEN